MRLSERERSANRAAFCSMGPRQKLEYVLAYYKLPLVLALIASIVLGTIVHDTLTHKTPVLYVAYANVAPRDELDTTLTIGFLEHRGADPRVHEVVAYHDLYLSDKASQPDHQYAYASRLKLMAAIDNGQLDIVLMNREAYDLLSASGYLLDLDKARQGNEALLETLSPYLVSNTVIPSDAHTEAGEDSTRSIDSTNAVDVTTVPALSYSFGGEPLYLGIIANTSRKEVSLTYLAYVLELNPKMLPNVAL